MSALHVQHIERMSQGFFPSGMFNVRRAMAPETVYGCQVHNAVIWL